MPPASSHETLIVVDNDGARWITLNRPDAMNALNGVLLSELRAAVEEADADPDCRAIVITGAGETFSAGADLKYVLGLLQKNGPQGLLPLMDEASSFFTRLEACRKPVIAAVNGIACAGGLEMVLACDLVIAAESARFGDAHANYGLLPGGGSSFRLPRKVGPTRAKYLLYTGKIVPVAEIADWGLVNKVVPDDALIAETEALVAEITAKSPLVMSRMKYLADDGAEASREAATRLEPAVWAGHAASNDLAEGLAAFTEKRKPKYTGT